MTPAELAEIEARAEEFGRYASIVQARTDVFRLAAALRTAWAERDKAARLAGSLNTESLRDLHELERVKAEMDAVKAPPCGHTAAVRFMWESGGAISCRVCDLQGQVRDAVAMEEKHKERAKTLEADRDEARRLLGLAVDESHGLALSGARSSTLQRLDRAEADRDALAEALRALLQGIDISRAEPLVIQMAARIDGPAVSAAHEALARLGTRQ